MSRMNALWNCRNPYQGKYKRVLTVCSAGLLRSPTIAWYLNRHTDYNCRACGIYDYALVQIDEVLIEWADYVICTEKEIYDHVLSKFSEQFDGDRLIFNLDIPDNFMYRDDELVKIVAQKLELAGLLENNDE